MRRVRRRKPCQCGRAVIPPRESDCESVTYPDRPLATGARAERDFFERVRKKFAVSPLWKPWPAAFPADLGYSDRSKKHFIATRTSDSARPGRPLVLLRSPARF